MDTQPQDARAEAARLIAQGYWAIEEAYPTDFLVATAAELSGCADQLEACRTEKPDAAWMLAVFSVLESSAEFARYLEDESKALYESGVENVRAGMRLLGVLV